MPKLIVREGYNRGAVHELAGDRTVLGRDPKADVPVLDEKASREHAEVAWKGGKWVLRDLGSRNGTRVNGVPVQERDLANGDEVRLGDQVYLYLDDTAGAAEGMPGLTTAALRTTAGGRLEPSEESRTSAASAPLVIGESEEMKEVFAFIAKAARVDTPVLVTGESGTGKEMVAQALHLHGARRRGAFVAVNCASLPETLLESELFGHEKGAFTGAIARRLGHFELASGGTLFLDEIGELSAGTQAKLLRVLENGDYFRLGSGDPRKADVRLVTATNRDLAVEVKEGRFRKDLYFRVKVVEISMPPLRERHGDVTRLAEHFLAIFRPKAGRRLRAIAAATMEKLKAYPWPGNVRELKNVIERAVILGESEELQPSDLPLEVQLGGVLDGEAESLALKDLERRQILKVLRMTKGNKKEAARLLGIDRKTLYNRLEAYGLDAAQDGE